MTHTFFGTLAKNFNLGSEVSGSSMIVFWYCNTKVILLECWLSAHKKQNPYVALRKKYTILLGEF